MSLLRMQLATIYSMIKEEKHRKAETTLEKGKLPDWQVVEKVVQKGQVYQGRAHFLQWNRN